jgi:hypothetical protein
MGWANDSSSRRRFISDNAVLRVCLAKISVVPEPASIEIFCFLANSGPSPDAAKNKFPTNPKKTMHLRVFCWISLGEFYTSPSNFLRTRVDTPFHYP